MLGIALGTIRVKPISAWENNIHNLESNLNSGAGENPIKPGIDRFGVRFITLAQLLHERLITTLTGGIHIDYLGTVH